MTDQPPSAPLIVSISGIRGIVGQSLTDDTVRRFAHAFATEVPMNGRVVLARDTRASGQGFAAVAAEALQAAGVATVNSPSRIGEKMLELLS